MFSNRMTRDILIINIIEGKCDKRTFNMMNITIINVTGINMNYADRYVR